MFSGSGKPIVALKQVTGMTRAVLALGPSDLTEVSPKLLSCNFVEPATRVLKPRRIQIKRPLPFGVALFICGYS